MSKALDTIGVKAPGIGKAHIRKLRIDELEIGRIVRPGSE